MNVFTRIVQNASRCPFHFPLLNFKRCSGAYDAPGQTTTTIVNHKDVKVNMIDTYSQIGFRLTNNSFLLGPTIILPDKVFHWHVDGDEDIHTKSLEFFFHLYPPLDILLIGLSHPSSKSKIEREVMVSCRKHKIQVEILPTTKAAPLFNFIVETRNVAGAFIPPTEYAFDESDIMYHKNRLGILHEGRDVFKPDIPPWKFPKEPGEK